MKNSGAFVICKKLRSNWRGKQENTDEIKKRYPQIKWKEIVGMRNKIDILVVKF